MTGRTRLAIAVAAVVLLVITGTVLLGAGLLAQASPTERQTLGLLLRSQLVLLLSGGALLLGLIALTVVGLLGQHARAPRRLAADTRLIATANPAHRLDVPRPADLAEAATAVNELAARFEAAEHDVLDRVEAGRADLARERNRLAALMSELAAAVLVCNAEGRILLYNSAARRLLEERADRIGIVGLGRSVFGVVDRDLVAHVLDRSRAGAPVHATTAWGEQILRVNVAAVAANRSGDEPSGFIVLIEDVTRRWENTRHRDALLRELTEGVRGAAAAVRGAIENLLEYPGMPADQRERFVRIIGDEAVALSARVDALMRRSAGHLTDRSLHEDMAGADLLAAVSSAVKADGGPVLAVEQAGAGIWLTLDGYAAVRAIAALLVRLRTDHGLDQVRLELAPAGRYAELTASWPGAPVPASVLRAWTADRAGVGPDTVADVLASHDAEAWSQREGTGSAYLRLLLPAAEVPAGEVPAGQSAAGATPMTADVRAPTAEITTPPAEDEAAEPRPEFYDFDLFRATVAGAARDDRRLDEIAYTVFDTETTGLQPDEGDEIIAIGAVRVVNGRVLRQETFDRLIDPRRSVPAASRRIHGITPDMLRGQPTIGEVLPAFARFAEDTVLVGHNVSFDMAFLRHKVAQTGVVLDQPVLDTLLLSAVVHPHHDEHSMEAMSSRLGVEVLGRHSALGDALLAAELLTRLLPLLLRQGIRTVGEAQEAARRTYHARVDETRYGHSAGSSATGFAARKL